MRARGSFLSLGIAALVVLAFAQTGEIRERAEAALGSGMPARERELARGFVLGQDERIDSRTIEDFRRAGLSHLLAVSGQNVALLALLAMPLLAALGIPLRMRLVWVLAAIAVYVPLAGAGPSIQRAGVMGALSVLAMLAGRRSSRLYALAIAAFFTLAIDPGIAAEVGWQLSFAAVLGILAIGAPLRAAIVERIGGGGLRGALADGAAMTVAATLATAPLIAFHFGTVSTTTLAANLLALPAVAPAMWLGMLAAAGGQVPGFPVEAINFLNAPLLAYIAQIAAWCGRPEWASIEVRLGGGGLAVSYVLLAISVLAVRWLTSRHPAAGRGSPRRWVPQRVAVAIALGVATIAMAWPTGGGAEVEPPHGLRATVFDVGQGDAILLQPRLAPAILIDAGPPGKGIGAMLRAAGVDRLGAAIVTHDQADHVGGLGELLAEVEVERVLAARLRRRSRALVGSYGIRARRLVAGDVLRSGGLRLEVLWPPRELLATPVAGDDPNRLSLAMLARWGGFAMLLSADAEAEAVPLDPGPVDVLKVAHHGSEDAGLAALLDRIGPRLAVVSAGDGNPFGHPAPATLATLASRGIRTLRTDRDGSVVLEVGRATVTVGDG